MEDHGDRAGRRIGREYGAGLRRLPNAGRSPAAALARLAAKLGGTHLTPRARGRRARRRSEHLATREAGSRPMIGCLARGELHLRPYSRNPSAAENARLKGCATTTTIDSGFAE